MTNPDLTHRAVAILRATGSGRVRVSLSDQPGARALIHAGLISPARPGRIGEHVPARLTDTGRGVLADAGFGARGTAA